MGTEKPFCQAQLLRQRGKGWRKHDLRSAWVRTHSHNTSLCLLAAPLGANIVGRLVRSQTGPLDRSLLPEPCRRGIQRTGAGHLRQRLSASALLTFWTKSFFVAGWGGGLAVHCRLFHSIRASTLLEASSTPQVTMTRNVLQVQNHPC